MKIYACSIYKLIEFKVEQNRIEKQQSMCTRPNLDTNTNTNHNNKSNQTTKVKNNYNLQDNKQFQKPITSNELQKSNPLTPILYNTNKRTQGSHIF